jgi:hypothetical protein
MVVRDRRKRSGRRAGSVRTCIGCQRKLARAASLRVVRAPEGGLLPDLTGRLPGRGAHLCPDAACFLRAEQRQAFQRALGTAARPGDLTTLLAAFGKASRARVLALLATATRAGWLHPGRDAVRDALAQGQAAVVLLAEDGSDGLRDEIAALAERAGVPCRTATSGAELADFHHGRPLSVLSVRHRGLGRRLLEELDCARALSDSLARCRGENSGELTLDHEGGKMPLSQRRPGRGRTGKGV